MDNRIKGCNSHGFTNESLMVEALNNKMPKELNSNLKRFIKDICTENKINFSNDMLIRASLEKNNRLKQDFYINIEGRDFGISTKMGTGNSVHQEKIEEFIEWLDRCSLIEITDEIKDCLRFFIWGDGSLNGQAPIVKDKDGNIIGRFGASEFRKLYPDKKELLQGILGKNSAFILNRAIFEGKNNSKVNYIYHGNPLNGVWISKSEVLEFNIKNAKFKGENYTGSIYVGRLTVQPWNASLKGNTEEKRGQIQFKYSCMVKDFEVLMMKKISNIGTFEGDKEEFNLSQVMNKNQKHKFWSVLFKELNINENNENYYIVKVDGNKESTLTGKKVKCKTDNYMIKANINKDILLQWEYQITETLLKKISHYKIIDNSGISVKRADSKKYTIVKLTHNTFKKAFNDYLDDVDFIMAGLLLYSEKEKLYINQKILKDLDLDEKRLLVYYEKTFGIIGDGILDEDFITNISKKAKLIVQAVIEKNERLKEKLFSGKEWFKQPYCINFIFKNGELTNNIYTDYTISNGSGRSKGIYSIILKPTEKKK